MFATSFSGLGFVDILQNDPPRLTRGTPLQSPFDSANAAASDSVETITTTTTAADTRNAQELQARIKTAGGVIKTTANSSDYIVAVNNRLKFSVTRTADGSYEIRESNYFWLLIGAAAIVSVLVIAKR